MHVKVSLTVSVRGSGPSRSLAVLIATIPAGTTGNTAQVLVTLQPPANAVAGDYNLTIRATSTDESSAADSVDVRTTVDTSPIGLLIGIGILIVVAAGLFFVFQRYGRR